MVVTHTMRQELKWWINNLIYQKRRIRHTPPEIELSTDVSLMGYGANYYGCTINGRWKQTEQTLHINVLELIAIKYALISFQDMLRGKHVKILSDNTTAVNYVNNGGGE